MGGLSATSEWVSAYETSIGDAVDLYEDNLLNMKADLVEVSEGAVDEIVEHVECFKENMFCGLIETCYVEMHGTMCNDLLGGFLQVGLSVFLLAIFNVPIVVCAALLVKRLR